MKGLDVANERFLSNLRSISVRMDRAQREVGSGKRVTSASDDPDALANLMQAHTSIARLEQTKTNLGRVRTEVDAAEGALQSSVKLMDRVRTLAMTGASNMQTAETRENIAGELGSIIERLVGIANTEVDGRFIFSGDSDQGPAFLYDTAQVPAWGAYLGAPATRRAMHPTGVTFGVSRDAGQIFANADPTKNVLQAIETMRAALLSGDDAAMTAALAPLSGISTQLNSALSFYGTAQSQLTEATDTTARLKLQMESERSTLEDADMTEAIVELQQLKFSQQAALEVRSKVPRTSLFDFLG